MGTRLKCTIVLQVKINIEIKKNSESCKIYVSLKRKGNIIFVWQKL